MEEGINTYSGAAIEREGVKDENTIIDHYVVVYLLE